MPNNWIKALINYNKDNKDHWCIPKKGSKNYEQLQKIKDNLDNPINEDKSASKIQALVRGVQYRETKRKEARKQALAKYKNLKPESSLAEMIKPNRNLEEITMKQKERKKQMEIERNEKERINKERIEKLQQYMKMKPSYNLTNY